ncbi:Alkyl hydroperoxide reductase C [BD1-7 clade bacterium]|uniref:Alkyl hydroperoxide reductase C n=1 Tax=BD1-7 clade bacterium TaxID=2029982 RepID=A0A5S9QYH4_9GAMM|nr:Alkyl hydroperoxide reductase C [BD1-7 clade bacterium]
MNLRINSTAPNFQAKTTQGPIDFHQWIGEHWAILFSHPKDFTPVCTTELGYMAGLADEFAKRNCKVMGLSADSLESHREWEKDIAETQGHKVNYPIVADADLAVSKLYNMLPEEVGGSTDERTPANNATVRSVFVIGPDKRIKMMMTYPMTTGRNFHELLRVVDSMQLTSEYKVATPANWQQGEDVIIVPTVSDKEAHELFPNGYDTVKPYLRTVSQPGQTSSHKGGRIH